jgi:hypothetical protein
MAIQPQRDFFIEPGVVDKVRLHSNIVKAFGAFRQRHFFGVPQTPEMVRCEERMVKARNDGELLLAIRAWLQAVMG